MLHTSFRAGLALAVLALSLPAQEVGDLAPDCGAETTLLLKYGSFDPRVAKPALPATLRGAQDVNLWLVQFCGRPTDASRAAVVRAGGQIHHYMPHNSYVVRMPTGSAVAVSRLPEVRWVGYYEPGYRLEGVLLQEHVSGVAVPERKYNIVVVDKHRDKPALAAKIQALGGEVVDHHEASILFTVRLDAAELLAAARLDEVLWIERWTAPEEDMNNARIQGGGNYVESQGGYTGSGIRGHVYEGVEASHPDFTTTMTNVRSCGSSQAHGHCTAGIVFGNGTSTASARGMAPNARGYYTNYACVSPGFSRNAVINEVVNVHNCLFTTASWGDARTTQYTAISADADDIIFDHRIPWTQSQSNAGNQMSRPQAWAKNIISVGGVVHFNDSNPANDSWSAGGGSTGPAADGRIKPDLCAYYDSVLTSDLTSGGYSSGSFFTGFNGTSAATPIVAGHNALAIQMYTDGLFGALRVPGGTRFQNRPFAQTLKAIMIATAKQYAFQAADNRREHQGWGFPDLQKLYDTRARMFVVPEDEVITQGQTKSYTVAVQNGEPELRICMTFLEPAGNPASSISRVNDLTLKVTSPSGTVYWGNNGLKTGNWSVAGGVADTRDSVECVMLQNPAAGDWKVEVSAPLIAADANVGTPAVDATFALVVCGGKKSTGSSCGVFVPDADPTAGTCNVIPFGDRTGGSLGSLFASNNGSAAGGAVYFDIKPNEQIWVESIDVNTSVTSAISMDVYLTPLGSTHVGNETNPALWTKVATAAGTGAGTDNPSPMTLTEPLMLAPGNYGMALVASGFEHRYTNGTGSNQFYNDANLSLTFGSASNTPFSPGINTPRVANLTVHYSGAGSNSWTNQRYQTIVRRGQIGRRGTITGLAFAPCSSGMHHNDTITVRMSHVPAGWTMSNTFASNLPSPVTVLSSRDYTWWLSADQWNEIGLMRSFNYDGVSDLVIELILTGNNKIGSGSAGFHRDSNTQRLYATGWSGTPPATATGNNMSGQKLRLQFGCADVHTYGTGCGGLELGMRGLPVLGGSYMFTASGGLPSTPIFLNLGFDNGPPVYPWNLTVFGFTNCYFWHDIAATLNTVTSGSGSAAVTLSVPNATSLIGAKLYGQYIQLNRGAPGGATFSNYGRALYGTTP